jgi:hypothetical protein
VLRLVDGVARVVGARAGRVVRRGAALFGGVVVVGALALDQVDVLKRVVVEKGKKGESPRIHFF